LYDWTGRLWQGLQGKSSFSSILFFVLKLVELRCSYEKTESMFLLKFPRE
jgi:hypothetical protein